MPNKPSSQASIIPDKSYFGPFTTAFRQQIYTLIYIGYKNALPEIKHASQKGQQEPAISGFIAKAIKNYYRNLDCPSELVNFVVHDDEPSEYKDKIGRSRPRPDIVIESTVLGHPEYVFEAKRLQKNKHRVSDYVSSEGLGCFLEGIYAPQYNEAGMLGYVQSDSVVHWKEKVMQKIDSQAELLHLKSPQQDIAPIKELPLTWISEHDRTTVNRPITIYHILLDCCVVE